MEQNLLEHKTIFFSFIYISWRLITYNTVVVFALHWYESVMDLHVFPILNPSSTSLPIPSLWVILVHQPWAQNNFKNFSWFPN